MSLPMTDYMAERRQRNHERRIQSYYLLRRPSHIRCKRGQRLPLSYYSKDSTGWTPDRPSPRSWKEDEANYSRKERIERKRTLGMHQRLTWLAQNHWSLEWTNCGRWVLGPPRGTWEQYPRSKRTRQREARALKRKARALHRACGVTP